jgi:hypothetical protein
VYVKSKQGIKVNPRKVHCEMLGWVLQMSLGSHETRARQMSLGSHETRVRLKSLGSHETRVRQMSLWSHETRVRQMSLGSHETRVRQMSLWSHETRESLDMLIDLPTFRARCCTVELISVSVRTVFSRSRIVTELLLKWLHACICPYPQNNSRTNKPTSFKFGTAEF